MTIDCVKSLHPVHEITVCVHCAGACLSTDGVADVDVDACVQTVDDQLLVAGAGGAQVAHRDAAV